MERCKDMESKVVWGNRGVWVDQVPSTCIPQVHVLMPATISIGVSIIISATLVNVNGDEKGLEAIECSLGDPME